MPTDHVIYDHAEALAYVTFNRPDSRNAMTWEMYETLVTLCDTVESNTSVRVVVLRGSGGKAFVAGSDIKQFRTFKSAEDGINYERRLDTVIDRLEAVSKPTIAQIEGYATGGGFALAAACDIRICTPDSKFGVPIARTLGNCLSANNHARFLDLVGPARLKELLYTGKLLTAQEALAAGLVNRIVEPEKIDSEVRRIALEIAANAPLTIKATKEMIRRIQYERRLNTGKSKDLIAMCYTSSDFKEGVSAFIEKRPPQWRGN